MPRYPVTVVVKEVRSEPAPPCPIHKVGDSITINNGTVEGKICLPVLTQLISRLYGLAWGMPYANVFTYQCPDKGKVVYEIRRDTNHWWKDALSPLTESERKPQPQ